MIPALSQALEMRLRQCWNGAVQRDPESNGSFCHGEHLKQVRPVVRPRVHRDVVPHGGPTANPRHLRDCRA